jgi:ribosomal protein L37AE/L43A
MAKSTEGKLLYMRTYRENNRAELRLQQKEDRYMRRVLGICRSCDKPARRLTNGTPMLYCKKCGQKSSGFAFSQKMKELRLQRMAAKVKLISVTPQESRRG